MPPLKAGQTLTLDKLEKEQKFTQPPARYSEASLVRELEELGIGRPSTYAAIISTLQDRDYVHLAERHFVPTGPGPGGLPPAHRALRQAHGRGVHGPDGGRAGQGGRGGRNWVT